MDNKFIKKNRRKNRYAEPRSAKQKERLAVIVTTVVFGVMLCALLITLLLPQSESGAGAESVAGGTGAESGVGGASAESSVDSANSSAGSAGGTGDAGAENGKSGENGKNDKSNAKNKKTRRKANIKVTGVEDMSEVLVLGNLGAWEVLMDSAGVEPDLTPKNGWDAENNILKNDIFKIFVQNDEKIDDDKNSIYIVEESESAVGDGEGADGSGVKQMPTLAELKGKKVSICGDSISTFTGVIPSYYSTYYPEGGSILEAKDTWWMQVIDRSGMELLRNASFSGSNTSGLSTDKREGKAGCSDQRIDELGKKYGETPDVIFVMMGTNDLLNRVPMGSNDGTQEVKEGEITNFTDAYTLMLDKMIAAYPDAVIYCILPIEVCRWNDETEERFAFRSDLGYSISDYNAWINKIARHKGCFVLDGYSCGIAPEVGKELTNDGTHPNKDGAVWLANQIMKELDK